MIINYSQKELNDMEKFKKKHSKCLGFNSGKYIYSFSDSCGIGRSYWIECQACQERRNITDIESW